MLTELQQRVRRIVAALPESGALALAGGAALIVTGVVQRGTDDLDFFTAHPHSVDRLLQAAEDALRADGLKVTTLSSGPTFARVHVESDTDTTNVDLATDYRLMPALITEDGPMLAPAELAADKVLALTARAEPRDYIDFHGLAARHSIDELCRLAASKDLGFRREQLTAVLEHFDDIEPVSFGLGVASYDDLRGFVHDARQALDAAASPAMPPPDDSLGL